MSSESVEVTPEREAKKKAVIELASSEAWKWGAIATVIGAIGTVAAIKTSKKFNQFTNVSVKMSIPVMCGLGAWTFRYEDLLHRGRIRPEEFGIGGTIAEKKASTLPFYQQAMNYVYDHPFQFVVGMGVPLAATILHEQKHNTHLTISQKIMHSRVFAQGGVLSILLVTMGFREYMDRRGRFEEPGSEAVDGAENADN